MNHNFADWSTTVLFNNTKIDRTCSFNDNTLYIVVDEGGEEDIVILNDNACYSIEDCIKDYSYVDSRKAISWEDIRLYLKDKGYEFDIRKYTMFGYQFNVWLNNECIDSYEYFKTYEESRIAAIKYCLNLIKET